MPNSAKYYRDYYHRIRKPSGKVRKYYLENRERILLRKKSYYLKNIENRKRYNKEYYIKNREEETKKRKKPEVAKRLRELSRKRNIERRKLVLSKYGSVCKCCGENKYEFLCIDHINGGGNKHRKEIGKGGIYLWLIRNNFPIGFQVLCHNCNQAKGFYGKCPHSMV